MNDETTKTTRTFEARYESQCQECWIQIEPGDAARWSEDGAVIHDSCPDVADILAVTAEPCPRCFMVPAKNGVCCDE